MNIEINRKDFSNACNVAIKSSYITDALQLQVSDGALHVIGYDITTKTDIKLAVKAESGNECVMVDGKTLTNVLKKLKSCTVHLAVDGTNEIQITSGKTKCAVMLSDIPDFDGLKNKPETLFTIPEETLKDMIKTTIFAVSKNETTLPALCSEFFQIKGDVLSVVACDGFRMAIETTPVKCSEKEFIVPSESLNQLLNVLGQGVCSVSVSDKHVFFTGDNYEISAALIQKNYIQYERNIPSETSITATVKSDDIKEYIDLFKVFGGRHKTPIKCMIKDKVMLFDYASTKGQCTKEIEGDISEGEIRIGMNPNYLLDFIKNMKAETLNLQFTNERNAIVLRSEEKPNFIGILMPVNIKK